MERSSQAHNQVTSEISFSHNIINISTKGVIFETSATFFQD